MKIFIRNLFIAAVPLMIAFLYLILLYFNHNIHKISGIDKKNVIIAEAFNEDLIISYKLLELKNNPNKYKTLAIGTSRVLQFSSDMFPEPFFNLGYTVLSVYQTNAMIKKYDIRDKTIIIALDQWAFNSTWEHTFDTALFSEDISLSNILFNEAKLTDVLSGKIHFTSNNDPNFLLIGSGANLALSGVRADGSYYYGKIYHGYLNNQKDLIRDYQFKQTKEWIKNGIKRFSYGQTADAKTIIELQNIIKESKKRNNKLILFFPPFPPSIVKDMSNSNYMYIKDASPKITEICKEENVPFYDFTSIPSSDSDYIDGFHAGSKIYYELLHKMNIPTLPMTFNNPHESVNDSDYTRLRNNFFKNYKSK